MEVNRAIARQIEGVMGPVLGARVVDDVSSNGKRSRNNELVAGVAMAIKAAGADRTIHPTSLRETVAGPKVDGRRSFTAPSRPA
jgi:hypothetical protein